MVEWLRNVRLAVLTILHGMHVTMWYMLQTFRRKTFTQHYEYPEKPVPVKPRYRGFHRFDITTCTTNPPPPMNARQPLRIHRDQRKKKLKRCQRRPPGGAGERVGEARCYRPRGGFVYGAMRRATAAMAM